MRKYSWDPVDTVVVLFILLCGFGVFVGVKLNPIGSAKPEHDCTSTYYYKGTRGGFRECYEAMLKNTHFDSADDVPIYDNRDDIAELYIVVNGKTYYTDDYGDHILNFEAFTDNDGRVKWRFKPDSNRFGLGRPIVGIHSK